MTRDKTKDAAHRTNPTECAVPAAPRPPSSRRPAPRWQAGLAGGLLLTATAAWAEPSVPWTPSAAGRHAIERLVDEAGLGLTTTHWPLPAAAVSRALDALPATLPEPLDAARTRVRQELQARRGSQGTLTVRGHRDALAGYGEDATPGSSASWRSPELVGGTVAAQVGGRIDVPADVDRSGAQFRFDDTALVAEALGLQLQAWVHRSWWGPGWQSSLALGNNAPALEAVGLQRAAAGVSESRWLSWMGPWNFEGFVARTDDLSQPVHPYLIGTRLTLRPFRQFEVGLTKMAQWGGEGRPQSLRSFLDTFTGANSNPDTPAEQQIDPANTLAGFDVRLGCPWGWRCSLYAQVMGEDEAGHMPSRHLGLYGLTYWTADGDHRLFAEYAETGCNTPVAQPAARGCAYRNHSYPQGYTTEQRWLGASMGPDSRVITLGWIDAARDGAFKLHWGSIGSRIGTSSLLTDDPRYAGRMVGVSARRAYPVAGVTVTPELDWTRVSAATGTRNDTRVGVSLRAGLDAPSTGSAGAAWSRLSPLDQALWGAGLLAGAALLDHTLDDAAQRHGGSPSAQAVRRFGNALPFLAVGAAGATWLGEHGTVAGDVARSAVTASVTAAVAAQGLKYVVDRSRPSENRGASDFGHGNRGDSSFPSVHAAVAWAAVTPFARQYDATWLYGAAALTNAARVIGRDHWFSDTVAGSLLGYGLGSWFHQRAVRGGDAGTQAQVFIGNRSVAVQVPFR
ncbi:hypothetical protein CPZ87_09050 [Piscinibacter gummiphilus]|nr:hypothetical protein CPZ87_09050 [Piscinibacter gummiphilus]GLS94860.1 hypothetical protein GCM10007918_21520 [Piscinibacter gummiphilus]